jgi:hypothetical protein
MHRSERGVCERSSSWCVRLRMRLLVGACTERHGREAWRCVWLCGSSSLVRVGRYGVQHARGLTKRAWRELRGCCGLRLLLDC